MKARKQVRRIRRLEDRHRRDMVRLKVEILRALPMAVRAELAEFGLLPDVPKEQER